MWKSEKETLQLGVEERKGTLQLGVGSGRKETLQQVVEEVERKPCSWVWKRYWKETMQLGVEEVGRKSCSRL